MRHGRFPANKHVHEIHPLCSTANNSSIVVLYNVQYINYLIINLIASIQNVEKCDKLKMATLPTPFANDNVAEVK